jgi:hypothetical protein
LTNRPAAPQELRAKARDDLEMVYLSDAGEEPRRSA